MNHASTEQRDYSRYNKTIVQLSQVDSGENVYIKVKKVNLTTDSYR
jgi:hypothetical protein